MISSLALITSRDEADALELVRHDYAHILAEAVQNLFPRTQITFGPATDDGFYYDFAPTAEHGPFTEEELPAIEEEMRRIIAADKALVREVWTRAQVRDFFEKQGEAFKAQWVMELPEGETITMYRTGDGKDAWIDLCRGPHLASTGKLDPNAFKLTRVSGAYWRGDPKNPMLSRIYGTAWLNKKQLDAYLVRLEEAGKRDHRKIAQEMDLFHLQAEAHGSVFWHPNGFVIWRAARGLHAPPHRRGGLRGNQNSAADGRSPVGEERPLGQVSRKHVRRSRRDPLDAGRRSGPFRRRRPHGAEADELPGAHPRLQAGHHQLPRAADPILREWQLPQERAARRAPRIDARSAVHAGRRPHLLHRRAAGRRGAGFLPLSDRVYRDLGFENYAIKLALRPEKRAGTDEQWDRAEQELRDAVRSAGFATEQYGWEELPGEGAFYAPKLEWHLTDAIGRTWQVGTIQADRVMPGLLEAAYVGEDGEKHTPVMLHRAIFGSYERFIGILIEHYAGKFPLWLAPVQAVVATIVSDADAYAGEVAARLEAAGIRVETDLRNEKINYKVREHSLAKVPLLLVVGKREAEEGSVAIRRLGSDEHQKMMSLDEAVAMIRAEAVPPDLLD